MRITIRVEWDMGHRLPRHEGPCRKLHGHRYVAEVSLEGPVSTEAGAPVEGMVVDFTHVKQIVRAEVAHLDHRFLVHDRDPLVDQLSTLPGVVVVPYVPTAENIAHALFSACVSRINYAGVRMIGLRLYETPTAWVDVEI